MTEQDPARLVTRNAGGQRPPLVMLQAWDSDDERVDALAAFLGADQPVMGIVPPPPGEDGQLPVRLGLWVDHARARLDELSLDGPIRLLGYSFGGTVALELARGIQAEGGQVAWLGLVDTMRPRLNPLGAGRWLRFHLHEALGIDDPAERREYVRRRMKAGWGRTYYKIGRRARPLMMALHLRDEPMPKHPLESGIGIRPEQRAIVISHLTYEVTPYDWPVSLFRTDATLKGAALDPSLRWSPYLRGGFTVTRVEGDHFSMWYPEHIASVGGAIRAELARAQ